MKNVWNFNRSAIFASFSVILTSVLDEGFTSYHTGYRYGPGISFGRSVTPCLEKMELGAPELLKYIAEPDDTVMRPQPYALVFYPHLQSFVLWFSLPPSYRTYLCCSVWKHVVTIANFLPVSHLTMGYHCWSTYLLCTPYQDIWQQNLGVWAQLHSSEPEFAIGTKYSEKIYHWGHLSNFWNQ